MSRLGFAAPAAVLAAGCAALPLQPEVGEALPARAGASVPIPGPLAAPLRVEAPPPSPGEKVTLARLAGFALSHNPATVAAWAQARAAAANLGSRQSAYYPLVDGSAQVGYSYHSNGSGTLDSFSGGPNVSLNWLLLDAGERSGNVGEARSLVQAANLANDATILSVLYEVEQSWFDLLSTRAQVRAATASLKDAQAQLQAARVRHDAGATTLSDVLLTQTHLSQVELALQSAEGQAEIARGALATTAGLPPTTNFEVGELPSELPLEEAKTDVERLIAQAEKQRPDLARTRALVEANAQHARAVAASPWPTLRLNANAGRTWYTNGGVDHGDNYGAAVVLSVPLFDGFRRRFDLLQAREQQQVASAQAAGLSQQVALQVWTSYQALQTASRQAVASRSLLQSAQQSEDVALGRYKEGEGSLLDLLTAQSDLASARAQEIQSRANWLVAMAALARDTGSLGLGNLESTPSEHDVQR